MTMPNFLIIGAAKSGTTALYHYMKQHPEIYMPSLKEAEFFAFEDEVLDFCGPGDMPRDSITSLAAYQAQFQAVSGETAIGEASPVYLYSPKASERIHYHIPNAKLIAILRAPVERAYSQFLMFIRDGRETTFDFSTALREEENRCDKGWAWGWRYMGLGFYYVQLKRYFDKFDSSQIKVYLYEDLSDRPMEVLQSIFQFLEVDESFTPDISTRHNISGMPKNKILHTFLTKQNLVKAALSPLLPGDLRKQIVVKLKSQNFSKPQLSPEIRSQLVAVFREDILQLQDLIQRDLSSWLV